jgi:SAM-dependent methyltransferase
LIISNDVFEHVAYPLAAFAESLRVLRPGGQMIMTVPFWGRPRSLVRAMRVYDEERYFAPKVFHGNPVKPEEGSLVYTDFGWDVLGQLEDLGFSDARVDVFHDPALGHFGQGLSVFMLQK